MAAEPTPRPWRINKYHSIGAGSSGCEPIVATVEPLYGVDTRYGDHTANAALIVRAVNAHDELLAALRLLLADTERTAENSFKPSFADTAIGREEIPWRDGWRLGDPEGFEICQRARAALAKGSIRA